MNKSVIRYYSLTGTILLLFVSCVTAQSSKKLIHDGNKQYESKKYNEAEVNYKKSLNTKENQFIGNYNLGNTYYQQGKFEEATQQFLTAGADKSANKENLSKSYHNLGNSFLKEKKFEESIEAYKQALKQNPKDNDTRYNLAYAQAMLQQQQQQQQNKDQNKDKKDQDKNQQQKKDQQKQEQQKQEQQKQEQAKEDQKKQEQVKKDKISKEDAEKILQALNNDEKKTQKKLNVKQSSKVTIEKEW